MESLAPHRAALERVDGAVLSQSKLRLNLGAERLVELRLERLDIGAGLRAPDTVDGERRLAGRLIHLLIRIGALGRHERAQEELHKQHVVALVREAIADSAVEHVKLRQKVRGL